MKDIYEENASIEGGILEFFQVPRTFSRAILHQGVGRLGNFKLRVGVQGSDDQGRLGGHGNFHFKVGVPGSEEI